MLDVSYCLVDSLNISTEDPMDQQGASKDTWLSRLIRVTWKLEAQAAGSKFGCSQ
jgi:hypothetical protein